MHHLFVSTLEEIFWEYVYNIKVTWKLTKRMNKK